MQEEAKTLTTLEHFAAAKASCVLNIANICAQIYISLPRASQLKVCPDSYFLRLSLNFHSRPSPIAPMLVKRSCSQRRTTTQSFACLEQGTMACTTQSHHLHSRLSKVLSCTEFHCQSKPLMMSTPFLPVSTTTCS